MTLRKLHLKWLFSGLAHALMEWIFRYLHLPNWFVVFNARGEEEKRKERSQWGDEGTRVTGSKALCPVVSEEVRLGIRPEEPPLWAVANDLPSQTLTSLNRRMAQPTWKAAWTSWGSLLLSDRAYVQEACRWLTWSRLFTTRDFIVIAKERSARVGYCDWPGVKPPISPSLFCFFFCFPTSRSLALFISFFASIPCRAPWLKPALNRTCAEINLRAVAVNTCFYVL